MLLLLHASLIAPQGDVEAIAEPVAVLHTRLDQVPGQLVQPLGLGRFGHQYDPLGRQIEARYQVRYLGKVRSRGKHKFERGVRQGGKGPQSFGPQSLVGRIARVPQLWRDVPAGDDGGQLRIGNEGAGGLDLAGPVSAKPSQQTDESRLLPRQSRPDFSVAAAEACLRFGRGCVRGPLCGCRRCASPRCIWCRTSHSAGCSGPGAERRTVRPGRRPHPGRSRISRTRAIGRVVSSRLFLW